MKCGAYLSSLVLFAFGAVSEDAGELAFRNEPATVQAAYAELSSMSAADQRHFYVGLSPSMRGDVWIMHLDRFLKQRGDLTDAERGVIHETMGLLEAGLMNVDPGDPDWQYMALGPLKSLEERARVTCRLDVIKAAVASLDDDGYRSPRDGVRHSRLRTTPHAGPAIFGPCTCSIDHDWCETPTSPERCTGVLCEKSTWGCGFLFLFACDGQCL